MQAAHRDGLPLPAGLGDGIRYVPDAPRLGIAACLADPTDAGCAWKQQAGRGHYKTATLDTEKVSRAEGRGTSGPLFSKDNRSWEKANLTKPPLEGRQNIIMNRGQTSASEKLEYQVLDLPSHSPQLRH